MPIALNTRESQPWEYTFCCAKVIFDLLSYCSKNTEKCNFHIISWKM